MVLGSAAQELLWLGVTKVEVLDVVEVERLMRMDAMGNRQMEMVPGRIERELAVVENKVDVGDTELGLAAVEACHDMKPAVTELVGLVVRMEYCQLWATLQRRHEESMADQEIAVD